MTNRIRAARAGAADQGFTLIEMLIVIVVLGILAGITVFGVSTFKKDSEDAACKANVKTVGVAADAFKAKTGAYPTTIADLTGGGYLKSDPGDVTLTATQATGCTPVISY
jgi:general secretion pathway protein G